MPRSEVLPRPGQKFGSSFLLHVHRCSASDGRKSEWKTSSMEGKGKGDGHQYGRKPRTPEPIPAGKTHLVRKRWDIGLLRALSPRIMMMMTKQNLQIVQNCSM